MPGFQGAQEKTRIGCIAPVMNRHSLKIGDRPGVGRRYLLKLCAWSAGCARL